MKGREVKKAREINEETRRSKLRGEGVSKRAKGSVRWRRDR